MRNSVVHRRTIGLGTLRFLRFLEYEYSGGGRDIICNTNLTPEEFETSLSLYPAGRQFESEHLRTLSAKQMHAMYVQPINDRATRAGVSGSYLLRAGDNHCPIEAPAFARTRPVVFAGLSVLQDLLRDRMFDGIEEALNDIPFAEKNEKLIWRGATTGRPEGDLKPGLASSTARFSIPSAVQRADGRPFDLGYSLITRNWQRRPNVLRRISPFAKPALSIGTQLESRFLLALEGNDVASGLRWMLSSNSVVIMPHPTVTSLNLEGDLLPGVHYIPVRNDLRDLNEVYDWCLLNSEKCIEISTNGKEFISPLLNVRASEEISQELVGEYFTKVRIRRASSDIPSWLCD